MFSLMCLCAFSDLLRIFSLDSMLSWVPTMVSNRFLLSFPLELCRLGDVLSCRRWRMPDPTYPIRIIIRVHQFWLRIISSMARIRNHKRRRKRFPFLEVLLVRAWAKLVLYRGIIGGRSSLWQRRRHVSSFEIRVVFGAVHVAERKRFECGPIKRWKRCEAKTRPIKWRTFCIRCCSPFLALSCSWIRCCVRTISIHRFWTPRFGSLSTNWSVYRSFFHLGEACRQLNSFYLAYSMCTTDKLVTTLYSCRWAPRQRISKCALRVTNFISETDGC